MLVLRCTPKWFSHIYTYIYSYTFSHIYLCKNICILFQILFPYRLLLYLSIILCGLVCCSSWGCKESDMTERLNWTEYSRYLTFILYLVVCMLIPVIYIPLHLSPLLTMSLLSMSVCLFLFYKWAHLYLFFQIPHISNIIWYLSFSVWLTSLCMIISRSIQVAANGIISFFFDGWVIFHCIYIYHIFFNYSSVNEHLGCFHVLAIVNSAAMNTEMHVSFWTRVFSGYMPRVGFLDHMAVHGLTKSRTWLNNWIPYGNSMKNMWRLLPLRFKSWLFECCYPKWNFIFDLFLR